MKPATVIRLRPRPRPAVVPVDVVETPAESGVLPVARQVGWNERRLRDEVVGIFSRLGAVDRGDTVRGGRERWDGTKVRGDEGSE